MKNRKLETARSELHIGIIPLQKIQIPQWNINNNNSGRNNDSNRNPVTEHLSRCSSKSSVTQHVPALLRVCVYFLSISPHFSHFNISLFFCCSRQVFSLPYTFSLSFCTVKSGSLNEELNFHETVLWYFSIWACFLPFDST